MPVDVASGEVFTAWHDVELPGVIPLTWRRYYNSGFLSKASSVLGPGWWHSFLMTLKQDLDGFTLFDEDGHEIYFDDPDGSVDSGGTIRNLSYNMELCKKGDSYIVTHWHHGEAEIEKFIFNQTAPEKEMTLGAIENPYKGQLLLKYDENGRLSEIVQMPEKRSLILQYNEFGLIARILFNSFPIHLQELISYKYDEKGRLINVLDGTGKSIIYEYDEQDRLISETNRTGGTFRMRYDQTGKCIEISGDGGYKRQVIEYNERAKITRSTDSLGYTTIYELNDNGQVTAITTATGAKTAYQYDDYGRIIAEIDPLGRSSRYRYNDLGDRVEVTDISGTTVKIEYNNAHLPIKLETPDGACWLWEYNEENQLVSFTNPKGGKWSYIRNIDGSVSEAKTPSGQHIRYRYSNDMRSVEISDQFGAIRREFDPWGNLIADYDAEGLLRSYEYDSLGRLVKIIESDGAEITERLNELGILAESIDANGYRTRFHCNAYGDLLEKIDPKGNITRWEYDLNGRISNIYNEKNERLHIEYDADDNIIMQESFDGRITRYEVDLAGQLTKVHKPDGTTIEYERDPAGNIVAIKYPDGSKQEYKYNWANQIIWAKNADSEIKFEYDLLGNLISEEQFGLKIEYVLDNEGILLEQKFNNGIIDHLAFDYDQRQRLLSIKSADKIFTKYNYDSLDRIITREMPGGSEHFTYDKRRRVKEQLIKDHIARTLINRQYNYDNADNLLSVKDNLRGQTSYHYDEREQLTKVICSDRDDEIYSYDPCGNLIATKDFHLNYDKGNRLISAGKKRYEYDANGNVSAVIEDGKVTKYIYDAEGFLRTVEHPDGTKTSFGYDPLGRRVWKEHNGIKTYYFWAKSDLLAEECQDNKSEYLIGNSYPISLWHDGNHYEIITSHIFMPYEILDDNGEIVWSGEYDAFANLLWEKGIRLSQNLRLPGQYFDKETGLHYNVFRYYDPSVYRFLSPDPLNFGVGLNDYIYAVNPINWIDPLGLRCKKQHQYITYVVRDGKGNVIYVGRASGRHGMTPRQVLLKRQAKHRLSHPSRRNWKLRLDRGNMTYAQARGREQRLFEQHGGQPRPRGFDPHAPNAPNPNNSKLLNIDNPISERNPNRQSYLDAADALP